MRYLVIHRIEEAALDGAEGTEFESEVEAWTAEMDRRGVRLQGEPLRSVSQAETVRIRGGEVLVSDGPFAETKEQIAGFDLIECASMAEAVRSHPGTPPPRSARSSYGRSGTAWDSDDARRRPARRRPPQGREGGLVTGDEYQPVAISRRTCAPAHDIFQVLANPVRHPEFDGSAMLRGVVWPRSIGARQQKPGPGPVGPAGGGYR